MGKFGRFWLKNQARILLILLFIVTVAVFARPYLDTDFGWHHRNGQILLTQGRFVRADEFSWTMTGYERAYNWPTEAVFYLLESWNLYWVLTILFALISAIALFLVIQSTADCRSFWPKVFAIIFGAILLVSFVGVRTQVVSILFFSALWVIFWRRFFQKRVSLVLVPFLFVLWANFHYAFFLGLVFLLFFSLIEGGKFLGQKLKLWPSWLDQKRLKKEDLLRLAAITIFSFGSVFLTPYGILTYQTVLKDFSSNYLKQNIVEWVPVTITSEIGLLFFIYVVITVIFLATSWKKVTFSIFCLWFVTLVLALSSVRNIPLFTVASTPFLVNFWPKFSRQFPLQSFWVDLFGPAYLVLFAVILLAFQAANIFKTGVSDQELARKSSFDYPVEAVKFLKTHPQEGKVFNSYKWGGYLIWQLPEVKTFIDGRMPGWRENKINPFADYLTITKVENNTLKLLDQWNISWTLTEKDLPLTILLANTTSWEKVYEDSVAVIFKRNK